MREYSYSQARQNLSNILNLVCDDYEEVCIKRKNGDRVVIIPAEDYESLKETAYLLSTEANRKVLTESLLQAESGQIHPIEELFK